MLCDTSFADLMPNSAVVWSELERYNVDTTFPVITDYRKSKNSQMYSIQKQNTSSYDEYKMLKQSRRRAEGQGGDHGG